MSGSKAVRGLSGAPPAAVLKKALRPLIKAVEVAPIETRVEAEAKLNALISEASKGGDANDEAVADLVDGLVELVPDAAGAAEFALRKLRKASIMALEERKTKITGHTIWSYKPKLTEDQFENILLVELAQDAGNRRKYADSLWWLVVFWLGGIAIFLGVDGILHACCSTKDAPKEFLSDAVILALIGGTTASVLALFTIVAHFLFPAGEDLFAAVANFKFPSVGSKTPLPPSAHTP
jgi:hypothetical protein